MAWGYRGAEGIGSADEAKRRKVKFWVFLGVFFEGDLLGPIFRIFLDFFFRGGRIENIRRRGRKKAQRRPQ